MDIKGSDVQKLFSLMPESLENMVTTDEQYSSDDGTFVVFTPLATLHSIANDKPEELLDISVITKAVFTTLKECSKDADKLKNAAKIINELNAEFEKGISCLDVLLNSLPSDNPEDTNIVVDELFTCLQRFDIKNIPNVKNLIETVRIHQLFLNMQRWEKEAYEILEYDEEESDEENTHKKQVFNTKRETLFRNCDELLEKSPHEFQKMLALKDFPALFLLLYLRSNYKRELAIMSLDHDVLVKKLVNSAIELVGTFYNNEAEGVLNKIGMVFEKSDDINKTKEILTPLIIKLIRIYSHDPMPNDAAYIHNMITNLLELVGDINTVDNNGNTPLHAAMPHEVYYGSDYNVKLDLIKYLLHKKANICAINNQGQTSFELAVKYMKDSTAAEVLSIMLRSQKVNIDMLESALFETISRKKPGEKLSDLKTFSILEKEMRKFPQWSLWYFFETRNWFLFDNSTTLSVYDAQRNISCMTKLFEAMSHFNVPFSTFLAANIKNNDPATPAIVGALLSSSKVCSVAKDDVNSNVLEYLKQQPEICNYLNNNIGNVMTMLENINTEKINEEHERFAISYDILKICKFDDDVSPEYLLFTLKVLVEHVFSTQFVPVSLVAWLPSYYAPVIEEQVKQQLKSAVFAMIDQDISVEPIKAYLTEKNSGLNQLLFRSFVNNFLTEIHEREIARRESKLKPEMLTAYESLNPSFPSEGIIGVDFEKDAKVSKFSSRPTIVKQ